MFVKYVGKNDSLTCDYNGKRYCFNKVNPIQQIPDEVYRSILKSGHFNSGDVVPCDPSKDNDIQGWTLLKAENKELSEKNKVLESENKELSEKNKTLQDQVDELEKKKTEEPKEVKSPKKK